MINFSYKTHYFKKNNYDFKISSLIDNWFCCGIHHAEIYKQFQPNYVDIRKEYDEYFKQFDDGCINLIKSNYKPTKHKNYFFNIYYYDEMIDRVYTNNAYYVFEIDKIKKYNYMKKYKRIIEKDYTKQIYLRTFFFETKKEIENVITLIKLLK